MERLYYLLTCTVILGLSFPASAHADKLQCRGATGCPVDEDDDGNPIEIDPTGDNQCTIDEFTDKKGGVWKLSCTNTSPTGDFVWQYDEFGPKGVKEIGRCVYHKGRNNTWYLVDPSNKRQVLYYLHVVRGHANTGQENEATIHLFDKDANTGVEIVIYHNKDTEEWEEHPEETPREQYQSLDMPFDSGNIPRDSVLAEYATQLGLVAK